MVPQTPRRPVDILSQEDGSISAFALVALAVFCMLLGLAIDVTNVHRQKEFISVAADAAAHAGVVALAEKKLPLDIRTAALAAAETNAPAGLIGKTNLGASDVELVRFDPKTRTIIAGEANAVKVTLHRDSSVGNPVSTSLLRFAGVKKFEFSVTSVAYYGKPGNCNSSDGIYAKGRVTLTSGNTIGGSYCVHSQEEVWMPQTNYFQEGAGLSMPNLADCGTKCFDAANPGVEDAKFEMNLNMMPVADHIALVRAAMLAPTSDLKSQFFADKTLAADRKPLVDARIMNNGAAAKLVKGSVVSLTAAQYNDLMVLTKGNLPTGLVYNVDCRDRGNGPATWISIGGSLDRKDPTLTTSTAETVTPELILTPLLAFDLRLWLRCGQQCTDRCDSGNQHAGLHLLGAESGVGGHRGRPAAQLRRLPQGLHHDHERHQCQLRLHRLQRRADRQRRHPRGRQQLVLHRRAQGHQLPRRRRGSDSGQPYLQWLPGGLQRPHSGKQDDQVRDSQGLRPSIV
ncbi:MAG: pilus assembly protein TadG-related protein, partial [Pseudomonadota bacterium]